MITISYELFWLIVIAAFVAGATIVYQICLPTKIKLKNTNFELEKLRTDLGSSNIQSVEQRRVYEKRLSCAHTVIENYEAEFDQIAKDAHTAKSAVIVPIK
ncbi:hypothetical protein [Pararhizobium sp.]|uniref:hypothetical protein n=1 Tax=Pararhizobium sp. TaxID=1977563 RepID=UPI003D0F145B